MKKMKIYLAGPDVFRSNAIQKLEELKNICLQYNHIGLAPLDNEIEISDEDALTPKHSSLIFTSNINLIKECDIIIANLIPFRGACIDDGTAWEIGYGFALGKKIYGYTILSECLLKDITSDFYINTEFPIIENFGHPVNLMIADSIKESGGKILNSFELCLQDLNSNK